MYLNATTDLIRVNVASAADIEVTVSWGICTDGSPPTITDFDSDVINIGSGTGNTTILTGVASSILKPTAITVLNNHASSSSVVYVEYEETGPVLGKLAQCTLLAGEKLEMNEAGTWIHYDANTGIYPAAFNQVSMQDFSASGTYTPTSGMKWCVVIATGAGGGGGGGDTSAGGTGDVGVGGGGGAGETRIGFFSAAQVGASQTITINAAGTAGSAAGGNGGNGGTAVFGSLMTANGGTGGTGSGSTTQDAQTIAGGAGGTGGSGGTLSIVGGAGGRGIGGSVDGTIDLIWTLGGLGGMGFWGGGAGQAGAAGNTLTTGAAVAGSTALARGAGGSGAVAQATATGQTGGVGMAGGIMVIEFV